MAEKMGYGPNQEKEIETLTEFVDREKESDRYLVLGDFNSLPDSPAYNRILDRLDLTDPFPEAIGLSPAELRRSWPTAGLLNPTHAPRSHVCGTRPGLDRLRGYASLRRRGWPDGHGLSDHVPILGSFALKKA